MDYGGKEIKGGLYIAALGVAGLLTGCTPNVNSYTLFASLPAAKSAEQITDRLERAVVLGRRVGTQSSTINLDELFPIFMSNTFGSKITFIDGVDVYQQSSDLQGGVDNTIGVDRGSKTYSFFFNPRASTNQGVSGVLVYDNRLHRHRSDLAATISGELARENREYRVVEFPVAGQTIIVSFPSDTATTGFEELLRPFGEVYDVRFSLPVEPGEEAKKETGIQSPINEGPGTGDPENPPSPVGERVF